MGCFSEARHTAIKSLDLISGATCAIDSPKEKHEQPLRSSQTVDHTEGKNTNRGGCNCQDDPRSYRYSETTSNQGGGMFDRQG